MASRLSLAVQHLGGGPCLLGVVRTCTARLSNVGVLEALGPLGMHKDPLQFGVLMSRALMFGCGVAG